MCCSRPTSARRGTFSKTRVSSVSRLAIISGRVAFLAPEIGIVPFSGLPPTMRMRSMEFPVYPAGLSVLLVRDNSGGIVRFRGFSAIARLALASLEVLAQCRLQALLAPFLFGDFRPLVHQG